MPTSSETPDSIAGSAGDLKAFLGEHTPFQAMSDEELAELAACSAIAEFPAGAVVADYATRVPDDVWMVRTGHIALRSSADGTIIDTVDPGGIFGYMPLLTGGGMDFDARTTVPSTLIRLPGALVRTQFAKPAGLAFLASSAWNVGTADRPTVAPATDNRPVSELVHGHVLLVDPDTSVRDAVVRMTEHHVSYALIRLPDGGLGIFTDRDLRTRVVAPGLSLDARIDGVMSAPARTVTADLTADTVLMEMLECGLRHMPVLTSRGQVAGVLEDADLLAASARQSFVLRRSIGLATSAAELQDAGQCVTGIAVDLFRNGTKASATSAILSVVIDSLVRKALELALAEIRSRAHRRLRLADARQRGPTRGHAVVRRGQRPVVEGRIIHGGSAIAGRRRSCPRNPGWLSSAVGPQRCRRVQAAFLALAIGLVRRRRGLARRPAAKSRPDLVVAAHRRPRRLG